MLDNYATHLPLLIKAIEKTDKPILELGVGISTMIIHMMCKQNKRIAVSCENDKQWYDKSTEYESENHHVCYLPEWDMIKKLDLDWGVVFIDHRPAKRRRDDALYFKDKADIILIHDSEPEIDRFYGYKKIYPQFKYVYHYTKCKPYTTALSNRVNVEELLK